jgi:hypothetical protein
MEKIAYAKKLQKKPLAFAVQTGKTLISKKHKKKTIKTYSTRTRVPQNPKKYP